LSLPNPNPQVCGSRGRRERAISIQGTSLIGVKGDITPEEHWLYETEWLRLPITTNPNSRRRISLRGSQSESGPGWLLVSTGGRRVELLASILRSEGMEVVIAAPDVTLKSPREDPLLIDRDTTVVTLCIAGEEADIAAIQEVRNGLITIVASAGSSTVVRGPESIVRMVAVTLTLTLTLTLGPESIVRMVACSVMDRACEAFTGRFDWEGIIYLPGLEGAYGCNGGT